MAACMMEKTHIWTKKMIFGVIIHFIFNFQISPSESQNTRTETADCECSSTGKFIQR